jgi:DNA-binding NtrC family response regulator
MTPTPESIDPESHDYVFLTCFSTEFGFLSDLLHYSGMRLHRADTLEQADFLLTVTGATVLLCDAVFLDGSWRDCMEMLARCHPRVSMLIVADEVDVSFVRDAVNRGACAVSVRPLRVYELRSLILTARNASADRMSLRESSSVLRKNICGSVWSP